MFVKPHFKSYTNHFFLQNKIIYKVKLKINFPHIHLLPLCPPIIRVNLNLAKFYFVKCYQMKILKIYILKYGFVKQNLNQAIVFHFIMNLNNLFLQIT